MLFAGCLSGNAVQTQARPSVTLDQVIELTVKKGDNVKVDYLGTLEDGSVFDTSIEEESKKAGLPQRPLYEPLPFTVGAGQMIKGFDDAMPRNRLFNIAV